MTLLPSDDEIAGEDACGSARARTPDDPASARACGARSTARRRRRRPRRPAAAARRRGTERLPPATGTWRTPRTDARPQSPARRRRDRGGRASRAPFRAARGASVERRVEVRQVLRLADAGVDERRRIGVRRPRPAGRCCCPGRSSGSGCGRRGGWASRCALARSASRPLRCRRSRSSPSSSSTITGTARRPSLKPSIR